MVNPNRQDNGEPEGEDQLKNVVILHGQRGYGVVTRAFRSSNPLRFQLRRPAENLIVVEGPALKLLRFV